MANGYIGKISAVVTANTSDLSRKLSGAVGDVDKFANRIASSIDRSSKSAQDSLNNIFTPLQRLQRNIQAGLAGNVFRRDNVEQYIRSVQQAVSISEQLGKPLSSGASAFAKLSLDVQAAFLPALDRAQTSLTNLSTTLQQQGSVSSRSFAQVESSVNSVTQAVQRLTQAQQLVGRGMSGNELQFADPRLFGELNAGAALTQRAAELPADVLADGVIARQVRELRQFQEAAVQARAAVESIRLDPQASFESVLSAERRLESLTETARRARTELAQEIRLRTDTSAADATRAAIERSAQSARQAAEQITDLARAIQETFTGVPQTVDAAEQEFRQLLQQIGRFGGDQRGVLRPLTNELLELFTSARNGGNELDAIIDRIGRLRSAVRNVSSVNFVSGQGDPQGVFGPAVPPDLERQRSLERERARFASQFLRVNQRESDLLSNRGASTPLTGGRDPRRRILSDLGGEADVVRRRIESLAEPLRATVGPEVTRITNQFRSLARDGVQFTSQQVQALQRQIQAVNSALANRNDLAQQFLGGAGGAGTAGLNLGIDQRQLRGAAAEIEFLQDRLSRFSGEVRGPAVASLERYRQVVADVFRSGAANTEQGRRAIFEARQEVVRLSAALDGANPQRLGRQLQRVGDTARGAFGNTGLAIQQAAFAVDDFFSVTGGLDQRIRAAGNNISQLGFILGSTSGLIAGISISIGAQAAAAIIRFANGGRTAEDQTKALNDALNRQKTLVDELKQAFDALGESIAAKAFGPASSQARALSQQLEEISRRQREVREGALADSDLEVQRARERQVTLQRRLESETNIGRRVVLQAEIRQAREQERRATVAAIGRPAPSADQAARVIREAGERLFQSVTRGAETVDRSDIEITDSARTRAAQAAGASQQQLRQLLVEQRDALVSSGLARSDAGVAESIRRLDSLIASLEAPIRAAGDRQSREILAISARIGNSLEAAVQSLDDAGVGASIIRSQIESVGLQAERVVQTLNQEGLDPARKAALEAEATALDRFAASLRQASDSVNIFAEVLNRTSNQLAETVAQEARSVADQARRDANRAEAELAAGGPRNADGTRRLPGELEARAGRAADTRREAERAARQAEETRDRVRRQNDLALQLFERDVLAGQGPEETRQLLLERQRLQQQIDRGEGTEEDRRAAQRRIDQINQRVARQFEDTPEGRAATARADRADQAAQRAQEQLRQEQAFQASADRGDAIRQTPAQRAAQELAQQFDDIRASFGRQAEEGTGLVDVRGQNQALQRAFEDQARAAAPAIFTLADSVANAVLQGPSRAALNVTDVSSVEGARELNRLLRGDDPARDQNLVELQKQNQSLSELVRLARENGVPIAN